MDLCKYPVCCLHHIFAKIADFLNRLSAKRCQFLFTILARGAGEGGGGRLPIQRPLRRGQARAEPAEVTAFQTARTSGRR